MLNVTLVPLVCFFIYIHSILFCCISFLFPYFLIYCHSIVYSFLLSSHFIVPPAAADYADQRRLQAGTSPEGAAGVGGSKLGMSGGDAQSQVSKIKLEKRKKEKKNPPSHHRTQLLAPRPFYKTNFITVSSFKEKALVELQI